MVNPPIAGISRLRVAVLAALATVAIAAVPATSPAAASSGDALTCNATVLSILGINLSTILGQNGECTADTVGGNIPLTAGNRLYILRGATELTGDTGSAQSALLDLSLVSYATLPLALLRSSAYVTCAGGKPTINAGSNILEGGQTLVTGPFTAPTPLKIGSLVFINETVADETGITQRALRVATPVGNVVLAEARAGYSGNPCRRLHHRHN